jgi:hypothetical protein
MDELNLLDLNAVITLKGNEKEGRRKKRMEGGRREFSGVKY